MVCTKFSNIKICGIKTVMPQNFIDIADEIQYFDNDPKKLVRAQKMVGYGRRYIADDDTTVTDLAVDAAEKLMAEMHIDRNDIDLLIFVNQKPDFLIPNDACVAHGKLNLKKTCFALDINSGCAGYVQALLTASAILSSGAFKKGLVLAGDIPGRMNDQKNRKSGPIFGDAASATILEQTENEVKSCFIMGTDGGGYNKIINPFGGTYLPYDRELIDMKIPDATGEVLWNTKHAFMNGEEVFNFTMDVAPKLIKDIMAAAQWSNDDVNLFAIHQANKQIVNNIIAKAEIPLEKAPADVFTKYANNSTNSVVTVMCDQVIDKPLGKTIICAFGVGLSWGAAAVDLSDTYNGGISTYIPPKNRMSRGEKISYWIKYFKGEKND